MTLERPTRVVHEILSGPMRRTKTITLSPTAAGVDISVVWDVRLKGLLKLGARMVEKYIGEGTGHGRGADALEAEGRLIPP